MKPCTNCKAPLDTGVEVCPNCGAHQTHFDPTSRHNKIAAGVLAILLGGIGIHKFYLGRIGWGIVYILFCWTGIPSIAGLIEGIIYLTMSDAEFARRYG